MVLVFSNALSVKYESATNHLRLFKIGYFGIWGGILFPKIDIKLFNTHFDWKNKFSSIRIGSLDDNKTVEHHFFVGVFDEKLTIGAGDRHFVTWFA